MPHFTTVFPFCPVVQRRIRGILRFGQGKSAFTYEKRPVVVPDQACKPSSVPCASDACAGRQSSLWDDSCLTPLAIHPRVTGRAAPGAACAAPPSVRSCSRWGLPSRPSLLGRWWSLTPPFHSYRRPQWPTGDMLSVALCRRVTPPGRCPASCSAELGLSSSHP